MPVKLRQPLGKWWPWWLGISALLFIFALQLAVTGFMPGLSDPGKILSDMIVFLSSEALLLPLTVISGFAHDIAARPSPVMDEG